MPMREAIKVIADVLAGELGLISGGPKSQIMLEYERFNIPSKGLYIALQTVSGKAIGNNNYATPNGPGPTAGMTETQQVAMLYQIQIDLMSFGPEARVRKEEVYMALRSLRAQALMEQWNMQIARMPAAFQNAASLEETKMLNRFTMTIAVSALLTKTQPVGAYYNTFTLQTDVDGEQSPILTPEDPF